MRRRDFIKVIAGSAVAWPVAARAQQPGRVYRIGFITAGVPIPALRRAFYDALRMLGWIESKNFVIEERHSENRLDRLPALVAELVRLNVDVIVAAGTLAPLAAKKATSTISHRYDVCRRSVRRRTRCKSGSARRERHRTKPYGPGLGWKATGVA